VLDLDWPRISRWALLATVVMTCWLLAPVAKCSYAAFRDTPLDTDTDDASRADADRIAKGKGFFDTLGTATKACYAKTPLLDQDWKSDVFLGAAAVTLLSWGLGKMQRRR
jgi:hypothetical protein